MDAGAEDIESRLATADYPNHGHRGHQRENSYEISAGVGPSAQEIWVRLIFHLETRSFNFNQPE